MSDSVWRLPGEGANIAVLADCHIHAGGPQFPDALISRLYGSDVIVTLGDMGETFGLDQLQEIAPVIGVRGVDDAYDLRTARPHLLLKTGRYDIGCVFDAVAAGLAETNDPFVVADQGYEAGRRLFGCIPDILLHASTHRAAEARFGPQGSALNPGSPVLPVAGERPSFLRLKATASGCYGQMIWVA